MFWKKSNRWRYHYDKLVDATYQEAVYQVFLREGFDNDRAQRVWDHHKRVTSKSYKQYFKREFNKGRLNR